MPGCKETEILCPDKKLKRVVTYTDKGRIVKEITIDVRSPKIISYGKKKGVICGINDNNKCNSCIKPIYKYYGK